MGCLIVVFLVLAVVFAGVGFAVHLLWFVAAVFFVFWLAGFAFSRGCVEVDGGADAPPRTAGRAPTAVPALRGVDVEGTLGPECRGIGTARGDQHELEGVALVRGTARPHRHRFDPVEAERGRTPTPLSQLVGDVVDAGTQARSPQRWPADARRARRRRGGRCRTTVPRHPGRACRRSRREPPFPTTRRRTRHRGRRPASSPLPVPAPIRRGCGPCARRPRAPWPRASPGLRAVPTPRPRSSRSRGRPRPPPTNPHTAWGAPSPRRPADR